MGAAGGLHGEGERSGGFFLPLRASNVLEHSLFVAINVSLQTSQKYSGLNPKLSVSDATKTFLGNPAYFEGEFCFLVNPLIQQ